MRLGGFSAGAAPSSPELTTPFQATYLEGVVLAATLSVRRPHPFCPLFKGWAKVGAVCGFTSVGAQSWFTLPLISARIVKKIANRAQTTAGDQGPEIFDAIMIIKDAEDNTNSRFV